MNDSKLIKVLKSLTPYEFRKFGQFVNSPYFNRLRHIRKFYEALGKYYPDFENRNLTPEKIYAKVSGVEKYDYAKMKNLESDMMYLAEEFLSIENYKRKKFESRRNLLEELNARHLDKSFEKNFKELDKMLSSISARGEDFYFKKYNLELITASHSFRLKDYSSEHNLKLIADNFINYSLLRILKLYTYMINEQSVFESENKKLVLLNEIVNHLELYSYDEVPLIKIYYNILMLTLHEDDKYYFELKKMKNNLNKVIASEELNDVYICLRNHCTKRVLKGNKSFLNEYFELTKEELNESTDGGHRFIPHFRFMNIVITSLRFNETEWAGKFIDEHKEQLSPEHKSETLNLVYGMLYFAQEEFEKSLGELIKINFDDCHHKMHLRNLMLQNYYEMNYYEPALSLLDSYRHFLSRDKTITRFYKTINLNFAKYYHELLKIKMDMKSIGHEELERLLIKEGDFSNKDWMIEKLAELKGK